MNNQPNPSTPPAEPIIVSARQSQNQSITKNDEQYLQEPTLAFLESYQNHLRPSYSSGIFVLSLTRLQLNSIGDIGQFKHIQICDLSSNFIETIDSLILNCQQLIKLDLHSNRVKKEFHFFNIFLCFFFFKINQLPDGQYWKEMSQLKILYLHDNLLSSYDDIKSLAYTPILEILTLYDTPLSLKKNYRHHVVNSIWSLKVK
jgi:Leucine-rich repeat (LRR) protein